MGTGEVLIVIGAIVIAFSSVTAIGAISGKIEGVITLSERLGITAFLMILFVMGCVLLDNGIIIINLQLMKFDVDTKVSVDVQELFEGMSDADQVSFMEQNITYASDDSLVQELVNRGYELVKG